MDKIKIAYLAGIIDGEGCIYVSSPFKKSIDRPNGRYHFDIKLILTNSCEELIDKCIEIGNQCGVNFFKKRKAFSKPHHKRLYEVVLWRKPEVKKMLELVLPHLIAKKKEAQMVVNFINSPASLERNQKTFSKEYLSNYIELYNKMKKRPSRLTVEAIRPTSCMDEDMVRHSQ